ITGANGSGKSTLLAALLGRLPLDQGSAALGPGVVVGEGDQGRGLVAGGERSGLRPPHVLRPAGTLSPGERPRAALALLQARGVNLLVLDEPTNHLDLAAIEQLESALSSYTGTLLLVTHDRRLLDNVSLDQRWHVEDGRVSVL